MHAKMSDRNARAATFDTMPRTSWMLPSERVWTVEDLWAWSAEAEARAILAETEDGRRYATLAYLRLSRMPANVVACDAIVDALRSFVEA